MGRIVPGLLDALDGVVGGQLGGLEGAHAPENAAGQGGGVDVAGAVAAGLDAAVLIVSRLAVLADQDAGHARPVAHAGEDHILVAAVGQRLQQVLDIGLVIGLPVLHAGQEAGLGDIGHDQIGSLAEGLHLLHKGLVEARVQLAAVGHGRVHDLPGAGLAQGLQNGLDIGNLLGAAQVAGVEGVEGDALLLPVGGDGRDILGQVAEGVAGEAGRMGGQDSRGQNRRLKAAGRENRQRHSERALSHAGNVLDGQNSKILHGRPPEISRYPHYKKVLDIFKCPEQSYFTWPAAPAPGGGASAAPGRGTPSWRSTYPSWRR